jgi:hypothetical protein
MRPFLIITVFNVVTVSVALVSLMPDVANLLISLGLVQNPSPADWSAPVLVFTSRFQNQRPILRR